MKQGNFGPRKTIFFLLSLFMLTFQPGFARAWVYGDAGARADEWKNAGFGVKDSTKWEDAGFSASEAKLWRWAFGSGTAEVFTDASEARLWKIAGYMPEEAKMWKFMGCNIDAAAAWKLEGYNIDIAPTFKSFFPSPDKIKMFTAKYCKKGFIMIENSGLIGIEKPPPNPNDDDGAHCYLFAGDVFQVLGDNEGLYESSGSVYYISFGKGGRAVSHISAIVNIRGSYKYQSNAGLQIVPNLRILKTAK